MAADVVGLIATISRGLAEHPDDVVAEETKKGRRNIVRLTVSPDDMGRIIGRDGRVANAMRAVLSAAVTEEPWSLEISD